jgi:hypothetical protein
MPDAPAGSTDVLPLRPTSAADVRLLIAAVAASDIVVPEEAAGGWAWTLVGDGVDGDLGNSFNALMTATGDVDGEVLRWIASHVKARKRLSAH